jgi:hypothetical protein
MNIYPGRKTSCSSKYLTDRLRNVQNFYIAGEQIRSRAIWILFYKKSFSHQDGTTQFTKLRFMCLSLD